MTDVTTWRRPALLPLRGRSNGAAPPDPEFPPIERSAESDASALSEPSRRTFPVVRIMEGDPPAAPQLHVDGLLLDRDINLWTGHGGAAKSTLLLHTAVCAAIDRRVFGSLAVNRPGTVLLVLPEDGEGPARMMLDAIALGLELDVGEREVLAERLVMVSDEAAVNITRDAYRLRDTALEHGAQLVLIDPLRNVLGAAGENENDVAGAALDAVRREICRAAGATVVLTHHNRKPLRDAAADAAPSVHDTRGGGGWANGSRLVFAIAKRDSHITMTAVKSNRLRGELRHELELTIEAHAHNAALWHSCQVTDANAGAGSGASSSALTPGVGRALNTNERAALTSIDDSHEPGRRVSWSEWVKTSGLKDDTLKSIKRRLVDAGLADALPAGEHRNGGKLYNYIITRRGRASLETGWATDPKGERVKG